MAGGSGGGTSGASADLHSAARSGDLAAVQLIISSNPLAVNSRDKHSRTPYPFSSSSIFIMEVIFSELYLLISLCYGFS